jgi:hypothetical protein
MTAQIRADGKHDHGESSLVLPRASRDMPGMIFRLPQGRQDVAADQPPNVMIFCHALRSHVRLTGMERIEWIWMRALAVQSMCGYCWCR